MAAEGRSTNQKDALASGKRRDETRVAPPRSHRMIAAEGGAAGFCMALL